MKDHYKVKKRFKCLFKLFPYNTFAGYYQQSLDWKVLNDGKSPCDFAGFRFCISAKRIKRCLGLTYRHTLEATFRAWFGLNVALILDNAWMLSITIVYFKLKTQKNFVEVGGYGVMAMDEFWKKR